MEERALSIADWSILFGRSVITAVLNWFQQIYESLGMTEIWIAAVAFAAVFSIILVPLRGGSDISRGALGSFVVNQVNSKKAERSKSSKSPSTD